MAKHLSDQRGDVFTKMHLVNFLLGCSGQPGLTHHPQQTNVLKNGNAINLFGRELTSSTRLFSIQSPLVRHTTKPNGVRARHVDYVDITFLSGVL